MNKNKLALILTTITVTAIAVVYLFFGESKTPDGYSKVDGYTHVEPGRVTCQALIPSCGYCPGEVIDKECYIKKIESN